MSDSKLEIKFKNNRTKQVDVVFTTVANGYEYVVYKRGGKNKENALNVIKLGKEGKILSMNKNEQQMIMKIVENFNKGDSKNEL